MRDRIYAEHQDLVDFQFDEAVVGVFPDMIRRSVPGYEQVIAMTRLFAKRHATPGSLCYDLGCSLGASSIAMREGIDAPGCAIIAVDDSQPMIEAARGALQQPGNATPIHLVCADFRHVVIREASLVALQYSLQFVPPEDRLALLERIRAGLLPSGVLLLSEKVVAVDAPEQEYIDALHLAFKRANGYSELEISRKRAALEEVLVPETTQVHAKRLSQAGFQHVIPWFRCLNFISLIALP